MATVLVIGAGVTGTMLALYLHQKGYKPILFEKEKESSNIGAAMILTANGVKALSMVGLQGQLVAHGKVIKNEV